MVDERYEQMKLKNDPINLFIDNFKNKLNFQIKSGYYRC